MDAETTIRGLIETHQNREDLAGYWYRDDMQAVTAVHGADRLLAVYLEDQQPGTRAAAAYLLQYLADPAIPYLEQALAQERNEYVRQVEAGALRRLGALIRREQLESSHKQARRPLALPINSILALPDYVTADPDLPKFNLCAALAELFEKYGWAIATKLVAPYVWAPGWDAQQVERFSQSPTSGEYDAARLAGKFTVEDEFPGTGALAGRQKPAYRRFDLIHFVGRVIRKGGANPAYSLQTGMGGTIGLGVLQRAFARAQTRLFILQALDAEQFATAGSMARKIVAQGGPAVLVVTGGNAVDQYRYFLSMYAGLTHGLTLPAMVDHSEGDLRARLVYGRDGENLLQLRGYLDTAIAHSRNLLDVSHRQQSAVNGLGSAIEKYLHLSQADRVLPALTDFRQRRLDELDTLNIDLESTLNSLDTIRSMEWLHEGDGAVVMANDAEMLENIGAALDQNDVAFANMDEIVEAEISRAPRTLNANFAGADNKRVLALRDGLLAGQNYDFLLDVGPKWSEAVSAVVGNAVFPEEALSPDKDGNTIDVTLVSDDLSPRVSTAQMWLPRNTGASYPIRNGRRAAKPGPVALRVKAPDFPQGYDQAVYTARGRLCLYYETNLLQSALIEYGVVRAAGATLEMDNKVAVDYILSGNFQQVHDNFATRDIHFDPQAAGAGVPVSLNLAFNDNGAGGHRILVKPRGDAAGNTLLPANQPYGWAPYDPIAGANLLGDARDKLLGCFYKKDAGSGQILSGSDGKPLNGLDPATNGKELDQFKWDLVNMAQQGFALWVKAFDQIQLENSASSSLDVRQYLRKLLATSAVIQVARTGPSQYVFPWAMIYEYPLNISERNDAQFGWKLCKIVDEEWSAGGKRAGPRDEHGNLLPNERTACKYHDQDWHRKNIICPYGFWGLKHIIEEPPSLPSGSLANAARFMLAGNDIEFAMAATGDPDLAARLSEHLVALKRLPHVHFAPDIPAQEWPAVREMLKAPEIVYFLCHGEYDPARREPYLSIGPRDQDAIHRIYSEDTLAAWAEDDDPASGRDHAEWSHCRPLVFINGCHTADLKPGQIVNFTTTFTQAGASAVLGTEISVTGPVAIEVAESMFSKLSSEPGWTVGEALRDIRWELANKGNLLGLAYTLYGMADLRVKRD